MIMEQAKELAKNLRETPEYIQYVQAKERVQADQGTMALLKEYHQLQVKAQAAVVSNDPNKADILEKLQRMGELLQFREEAAQYLMAEYKLQNLMSDVIRLLIESVDISMDLFGA